MKKMKKAFVGCLMGTMLLTSSVSAATHEFNFQFEDVTTTKDWKETWAKSDNENRWYITLLESAGILKKSTLSSSNIFGCRMRDMTVGPAVDSYHTFSNHVQSYPIEYIRDSNGNPIVGKGHAMRLRAKKDDSSTSSKALKVYGKCAP